MLPSISLTLALSEDLVSLGLQGAKLPIKRNKRGNLIEMMVCR